MQFNWKGLGGLKGDSLPLEDWPLKVRSGSFSPTKFQDLYQHPGKFSIVPERTVLPFKLEEAHCFFFSHYPHRWVSLDAHRHVRFSRYSKNLVLWFLVHSQLCDSGQGTLSATKKTKVFLRSPTIFWGGGWLNIVKKRKGLFLKDNRNKLCGHSLYIEKTVRANQVNRVCRDNKGKFSGLC